MDTGLPTNERATLQALIAAAAPAPLPAEQALDLLRRLGETDATALGRLAYHALTGVDPGEGDPQPPAAVAPGFPPFAAEVLMRAVSGPDHRRPTAQALLIVLDTVPAASWPTSGRPFVTLDGSTPEAPVAEPVESVEPVEPVESVETPVVEARVAEPHVAPLAAPDDVVEGEPPAEEPATAPTDPVNEPVSEKARLNDEFRSLLTPSRPIPRFDPLSDPLTDPWEPDAEDDPVLAPLNLGRLPRVPEIADEPVADEPVAEETVADEPVDDEPVTDEPVAEEPATEESAASTPEDPGGADEDSEGSGAGRGMHDEFRNFASPGFDVPRFEPLEGELPAGSDRERRRRAGGRRHPKAPVTQDAAKDTSEKEEAARPTKPEKAPKPEKAKKPEKATVVHGASADDRRQTLLLVALLLVLVLLGAIYAASRDSDDSGSSGPEDSDSPQGASRSLVHPVPSAT